MAHGPADQGEIRACLEQGIPLLVPLDAADELPASVDEQHRHGEAPAVVGRARVGDVRFAVGVPDTGPTEALRLER